MMSPCLHCTRVRDPLNCENKGCKDWQAWFLDRWESMRENVRKQIKASPIHESGIPLGGNRYASPHRIQDYLLDDPCRRCLYPVGLCQDPCQVKQMWIDRKGEEWYELER